MVNQIGWKTTVFGVTQPAGALATLRCFAQVGKPELLGLMHFDSGLWCGVHFLIIADHCAQTQLFVLHILGSKFAGHLIESSLCRALPFVIMGLVGILMKLLFLVTAPGVGAVKEFVLIGCDHWSAFVIACALETFAAGGPFFVIVRTSVV